jgi:ubiquinone/menaquinone biosynthesis C-methylase UbiE
MKRLLKSGKSSKDTWDALAREDAMFYTLTDSTKKGGGWKVEEFLETGLRQWEQFRNLLSNYGLEHVCSPKSVAIDLGCGTGRLTIAMSRDFERVIGVDVSKAMIEKAEINKSAAGIKNCDFMVNNGVDLSDIDDQSVDFCFSYIALQHCPSRKQVLHYIREFSRVLQPNGVALFQFRIAPTFLIFLKSIISQKRTKLLSTVLKQWRGDHSKSDAFTGNWVSLARAYKEISKFFKAFYLMQTPIELYPNGFWDLSDSVERWKRSFWLCIK